MGRVAQPLEPRVAGGAQAPLPEGNSAAPRSPAQAAVRLVHSMRDVGRAGGRGSAGRRQRREEAAQGNGPAGEARALGAAGDAATVIVFRPTD